MPKKKSDTSPTPPPLPEIPADLQGDRRKMNLIMLSLSFILVLAAFVKVIGVFVIPLLIAVILSSLFYPLYRRILKLFKQHKNLSALVMCFLLILIFFLPLYLLGHLVTIQAIELYQFAEGKIRSGEWINQIRQSGLAQWFQTLRFDWQSTLTDSVKALGKTVTSLVNRTSIGILEAVLKVFITFFSLFYFFRDGDAFVRRIRYLSPLRDRYEEKIMRRFSQISRATIKGTLVIGLIQGAVCSLALAVFGVRAWVFWGVIILILSIIPMVGAPIVMIPVGISLIASGKIWQGVVVLVVGTVINTGVDYLLRPRLVARDAKMHDLLVLLSTIGGIAAFGIMGFIIGPVIAALFVTLLDIYGEEFRPQLSH